MHDCQQVTITGLQHIKGTDRKLHWRSADSFFPHGSLLFTTLFHLIFDERAKTAVNYETSNGPESFFQHTCQVEEGCTVTPSQEGSFTKAGFQMSASTPFFQKISLTKNWVNVCFKMSKLKHKTSQHRDQCAKVLILIYKQHISLDDLGESGLWYWEWATCL